MTENQLEEIAEFCGKERDDLGHFNDLNDYSQGYWMAMNTVMKKLEGLTPKP